MSANCIIHYFEIKRDEIKNSKLVILIQIMDNTVNSDWQKSIGCFSRRGERDLTETYTM